jgi:hypothetical protein
VKTVRVVLLVLLALLLPIRGAVACASIARPDSARAFAARVPADRAARVGRSVDFEPMNKNLTADSAK